MEGKDARGDWLWNASVVLVVGVFQAGFWAGAGCGLYEAFHWLRYGSSAGLDVGWLLSTIDVAPPETEWAGVSQLLAFLFGCKLWWFLPLMGVLAAMALGILTAGLKPERPASWR